MRGTTRTVVAAVVLLGASWTTGAEELLPLEVYGNLPDTSLVALSPSGKRVAFRKHSDGVDAIAVIELESGSFINGAHADDVNPRLLEFTNDDHLMLVTSRRVHSMYVRNAFEYSSAFDFNIETGKIRRPLERARDFYPYQGGLGEIVGRSPDGRTIYMPAFVGQSQPSYGYYRVALDKHRPRLVERGRKATINWYLNEDGTALIREDFDNARNLHRIWRVDGDDDALLYERETEIRDVIPVGLLADRSALVIRTAPRGSDVDKYFALDLDTGEVSDPILSREDVDIEHAITDMNQVLLGVRYTGFLPSYRFIDEAFDARVRRIQQRIPGAYSELVSWTEDREKLIFYVSGDWTPGMFLLFEGDDSSPRSVGHTHPDISGEHVARVRIGEYEAGDGLTIPMLVTARDDVYEAGDAPLILLPHGGPGAHDRFGFDWQAQYFASRGYVVLQPQFRGSTGFGNRHRYAGDGEWGRKMQTDLDDGVRHLIDSGVVDAGRVCVVGSSYGGYAALAAVAFSPDMYKCAVSFGGVFDLYEMVAAEGRQHGKDNWVVAYWENRIGSELNDKQFLRSISPAYHADNVQGPVLLLHGERDTVVPSSQSRRMARALKRAGKDVTFVTLDGEDHWFTQAETRIRALRLMAEFIDQHL